MTKCERTERAAIRQASHKQRSRLIGEQLWTGWRSGEHDWVVAERVPEAFLYTPRFPLLYNCARLLAANCEFLSEQSSCGNCPNCARSRAFRVTSRARGTFALLLHLLHITLRFGSLWIREKVILPEVRFYFWWSFMQRSLKGEGVCKFRFALSPEFDIILISHSSDVSIKDKCLVACKLTIKICEKSLYSTFVVVNIKL